MGTDDSFCFDEKYSKLKDMNCRYFHANNLKNKSFYSIIQKPFITSLNEMHYLLLSLQFFSDLTLYIKNTPEVFDQMNEEDKKLCNITLENVEGINTKLNSIFEKFKSLIIQYSKVEEKDDAM